jgi:hypothetical protein
VHQDPEARQTTPPAAHSTSPALAFRLACRRVRHVPGFAPASAWMQCGFNVCRAVPLACAVNARPLPCGRGSNGLSRTNTIFLRARTA